MRTISRTCNTLYRMRFRALCIMHIHSSLKMTLIMAGVITDVVVFIYVDLSQILYTVWYFTHVIH
jgi:hypothetical protein